MDARAEKIAAIISQIFVTIAVQNNEPLPSDEEKKKIEEIAGIFAAYGVEIWDILNQPKQ